MLVFHVSIKGRVGKVGLVAVDAFVIATIYVIFASALLLLTR